MNWRDLKVRTKIIFSFAIPILLTGVIGIWTFKSSNEIFEDIAHLKDESIVFAGIAQQMGKDVIQIQQWHQDISATRGLDGLDDGFDKAEKSYKSFLSGVNKFKKMFEEENDNEFIQKTRELRTNIDKFFKVGKKMAKAYIDGGTTAGNKIMGEFDGVAEALSKLLEPFIISQIEEVDEKVKDIMSIVNRLKTTVLVIFFISLALVILTSILLTLTITKPLDLSIKAANKIANGDMDIDITIAEKRGDEIGLLLQSFSKMAEALKDAANQADVISRGDYSTYIEPRSDKDILGNSLQRMTIVLRDNRTLVQRQDWLKTGITRLNEVMSGDPDLATLASEVISEFSSYLDAQVGAIYLTGGENGSALSLMGSYAFTKRKNLSNLFKPGEGLVGQAALEKKQILIQNVPEDYIKVTSGLGERVPRFISVTPFSYEDNVKGVIEIGTLNEVTDQQLEYLNQVMPALALAVEGAQARTKLANSLEESQALTEELQTQQEELQATNEEMEEQTRALKLSEEKLKVQQEELETTNEELEEKNELLDQQKKDVERAREDIEVQARDLALVSKYKSEFLTNMSHELRTPLNSLLLLAQSLSENRTGNLTEEQAESMRIIHGSGSDLLHLINEILDLSKIEAGRMDLQLGTVLTQNLANAVRTTFGKMAEKKGFELVVTVSEDAPGELMSDRKRIDQVIKNLISNAIKFTDSGSVTVTFAQPSTGINLSRSGLSLDKCLAIEVQDTGIGITLENQKIIFEAFQQVDSGMTRKFEGTGLGLSISRELTRLLGGEIQVKSVLGKGSTFTLFLPVVISSSNKTASGDTVIVTPARSDTDSERNVTDQSSAAMQIEDDRDNLKKDDRIILIIEDDPNFSRILYEKCHDKGFKCLATPTGEAGMELATNYNTAAILLDIRLPGIDGWTVLSKLKENINTRHIPVHIISIDDVSNDALLKGAAGYATKPLNQEDLEEAFRRLEQVSTGKPRRVLVVEDELKIRSETVKLISGVDVNVDEAGTGQQALELLRSDVYDCVVLDLGLPDMNGSELLKILEKEGVKLPPVIVYTAHDLTRDEEEDLREHVESVVIKDVRSQERLLDEVSLFLHRVVSKMPKMKRQIIRDLYNSDSLLKDKKVLIVDDDMRTTFALSRFLSERGMKPIKAENGEKMLRLLDEHPDVDIVLIDIMMPVMDGYEAMKRIRSQEKFRRLPIIAITAKVMTEDREKCLAAGANDYLPKPVDQQRLVSMMRVWLYR